MGFNVGLNLGTVAGGSLAEHLHMHVVPRWSGDANFITIIGGSKMIPQLLRETRAAAGDRVGEAAVSNFYLMTRAAYEKLSRPVAKVALRAGFTPDSITILGTAGSVLAALTLFPIGQLWWGAFAVCVLRARRHARRCDGPSARRRHPVRRGAGRHLRPDRRRRDLLRAAVVGGLRAAEHVAGGGHADLPGHLAGHLLHQGPRRGQRAVRRRRTHRAARAADHRAGRRRAVRCLFLHVPWLVHVAMWVLAVASLVTVGQRLHSVRTSPGAMEPMRTKPDPRQRRQRQARERRAVTTPADEADGSAVACRVAGSPTGVRRRLAGRARDAGIHGAQRFRRRSPLRGARRRPRTAAQEPGPGDRRTARAGAGRADSCFACLLRPILAGGVPVAVDGPGEAPRAHRAVSAGPASTSAPRSTRVGA